MTPVPSLDYQINRRPFLTLSSYVNWAGIDLRTLALFRVFLAIAILADAASYAQHLTMFFSDDGLYPRRDSMAASPWAMSLFYVSGHSLWALTLFTATIASAIALLFGFRTRVATVLCWLLVTSMSRRAEILTSGADMQLNLLLFWAMFLPLGARFSVDASLAKRTVTDNVYASVATLAIMLQVSYLYFFGALLKDGAAWRESFNAVYYSIQSGYLTSPLAAYAASWPQVLHLLTLYVFYLELFVIVILFTPIATGLSRLLALCLLITLHIGFALLLSIGIFPLVSITGLLVFVPGFFWDQILRRFNERPSRRSIIIYYDKDCHFCRKICNIFKGLGLPPSTPVEPAQNSAQARAILERENSWVVKGTDGQYLIRWDAVAYIWRRSPLLWPLGVIFLLPFMKRLGEALYELIAAKRGALGRLSARLLAERETAFFTPTWATQAALATLMVGVLLWNVQNLSGAASDAHPQWLSNTFRVLRLTQRWNMFAPEPPTRTTWVVIEGHRADGSRFDLLRGVATPASFEAPQHGYQAFQDFRTRKFFTRVSFRNKWKRLGRYYCREADEPFQRVRMYRFTQDIGEPGEVKKPPAKQSEYGFRCSRPENKIQMDENGAP